MPATLPPLLPIIGVSTNVRQLPDFKFHGASEKALYAIYEAANALPLLLPALGDTYDFTSVVERLDGLLLTGSASHVSPRHYGGADDLGAHETDSDRDATTLPLIRLALAAGVPILAICRGMQELNVALGGTLTTVADKATHSSDGCGMPLEHWLTTDRHAIALQAGGVLAQLFAGDPLTVNSAHSQVLAQLAPGLSVEATAPDGVIEAVSVIGAQAFAVGVQWHPEYSYAQDAKAQKLFAAFGQAARQRVAQRMLQADWTARLGEEASEDAGQTIGANIGS